MERVRDDGDGKGNERMQGCSGIGARVLCPDFDPGSNGVQGGCKVVGNVVLGGHGG